MSDAFDWIDAQQKPLEETLQQWSQINSSSHNLSGLENMHAALKNTFSALADECETIAANTSTVVDRKGELSEKHYGAMLRCIKRPQAKRRILLCGHMDTVFPVDSAFQTPRHIDENTINGPGVADMKGGLLTIATALEAFERFQSDKNVGWEVLINADEEVGSHGSAQQLEKSAKQAEVGLVYEPALADGTMVSARKGSGNFSLIVRGKTAHVGRAFDEGKNAIWQLAKAMQALHELNHQYDEVICNLGKINGGTVVNAVADLAICDFNIRLDSPDAQQNIEQELTTIVDAINAEDGYNAELHGGFTRPPKPFSPEIDALFSLLSECGEQLGITIAHQPTGGCCDGNNLSAAGLPNIDTLGVRGGAIHTEEEFILLDSLAERSKLSYLLISKINALPNFSDYVANRSQHAN